MHILIRHLEPGPPALSVVASHVRNGDVSVVMNQLSTHDNSCVVLNLQDYSQMPVGLRT